MFSCSSPPQIFRGVIDNDINLLVLIVLFQNSQALLLLTQCDADDAF